MKKAFRGRTDRSANSEALCSLGLLGCSRLRDAGRKPFQSAQSNKHVRNVMSLTAILTSLGLYLRHQIVIPARSVIDEDHSCCTKKSAHPAAGSCCASGCTSDGVCDPCLFPYQLTAYHSKGDCIAALSNSELERVLLIPVLALVHPPSCR